MPKMKWRGLAEYCPVLGHSQLPHRGALLYTERLSVGAAPLPSGLALFLGFSAV